MKNQQDLEKMNLLKSQYEGTNMTNEQLESIKTVIAEAKQQKIGRAHV